jgi:hypothetical protein
VGVHYTIDVTFSKTIFGTGALSLLVPSIMTSETIATITKLNLDGQDLSPIRITLGT